MQYMRIDGASGRPFRGAYCDVTAVYAGAFVIDQMSDIIDELHRTTRTEGTDSI